MPQCYQYSTLVKSNGIAVLISRPDLYIFIEIIHIKIKGQ